MIESVNTRSTDTNGNVINNNNEVIVNNNYELKFPYSIKSVEPSINQKLLKDFTGTCDLFKFVQNILINYWQ